MRTHRVRVYFIGERDELLAISSRLLTQQTAKRLLRRIKPDTGASASGAPSSPQLPLLAAPRAPSHAGIFEILDAEMYSVKHPKPLQDGVRQIQRLDEYTHLTERLIGGESIPPTTKEDPK